MTSQGFSLRLGAGQRIADYPAATVGELSWQLHQGLWTAQLELPPIDSDQLLTPSLSVLDNWPYDYQFELHHDERCWPLPKVPSEPGTKPPGGSDDTVRGELDCWQVRKALTGARLLLRCASASPPDDYLLTVTSRQRTLTRLPAPPNVDIRSLQPAAMSQMLENPRHAARICSPVSLAMVLAKPGTATAPLHQVLPLCHDPATGMYGMWPLAIRTASRFGVLGAVELLRDWSLVVNSLERQQPVIASIRYAQNALIGAPQKASHGHLVVVYGIENQQILVHDPAAPNRGSVNRRYDIDQFNEAWFRHRGAAYILAT